MTSAGRLVPGRRQKQQWGGSVPRKSRMMLTGYARVLINGPRDMLMRFGGLCQRPRHSALSDEDKDGKFLLLLLL